jgi:uncharacterized protein with von Willebrand factor type A (vWA) domain
MRPAALSPRAPATPAPARLAAPPSPPRRRAAPRRPRADAGGAEPSAAPAAPPNPTPPSTSAVAIDPYAELLAGGALPDERMARALGVDAALLRPLAELPGTASVADLRGRLVALGQWSAALRRGVLPDPAADAPWPQEPFRSKFVAVLKRLEMPRFTRRHPKLLAPLLRQFLSLAGEFEAELLAAEAEQATQQPQRPPPSAGGAAPGEPPPEGGAGEAGGADGGGASAAGAEDDPGGEPGAGEAGEAAPGERGEVEAELRDADGAEGGAPRPEAAAAGGDAEAELEPGGYAERLAEEMLSKFERDWAPAVEALAVAAAAFDDVDSLLDGPEGFDSSKSIWRASGWREVDALRRRLEALRELRDLVRSLGRGGGRGPLRLAPEALAARRGAPGVVRSEAAPEETRGLTRSGDLSRMLPAEAHLLAAGWPRRAADSDGDGGASGDSNAVNEGSRAARLLFMVRRAERQLTSYERAGWADDEPSRVTGRRELRPAAELGPIIVCLDTSGSMRGARETVAKALVLECMRGAARQGRRCHVYAFSGPGDVAELELAPDAAGLAALLRFLTMSFAGGTDVDAPLALALERVGREGWGLADVLMVTDGEIPEPHADVLAGLAAARAELGLRVHGLLIGRHVTEPMRALCSDLHVFRSWSAVE